MAPFDPRSPPCVSPSRADLEITVSPEVRHRKAPAGVRGLTTARLFTPDDYYEALVANLVTANCRWLDVGCGRDIFPGNRQLARQLSDRCAALVGVDPDETLNENPFAHEKVQTIEDFQSDEPFQLITLRMVAEHIAKPDSALAALSRLTAPGGGCIVYTVNQWSPLPILAWVIPFRFHHALKSLVWGTEEKDTFPVAYKMNTRERLACQFRQAGFRECFFAYLDDCRTLAKFTGLHRVEIAAWRLFKSFRLSYPENCLLGVYERH